jgi:glucosamine--fructose-6-phosphate aminotransferase (isomerizing)
MCGIIGYIGHKTATPILLKGLKNLEYRGYDSAGIAVIQDGEIAVRKAQGRLKMLEDKISQETLDGNLGIGHTRWATHGEPSDVNSHPQTNRSGDIAVVHNGIIENYLHLKEWLINRGYTFVSDTDTEVIAHLINHYYEGNLLDAVRTTLRRLKGSYAMGVVCRSNPDQIIAARKDSPLVVGIGNGENYIASDIPAILEFTRDVFLMDDYEIALIKKDGIQIYDLEGDLIQKDLFHVDWDVSAAEKGGYEHFMIKEIHEQPDAIKATLSPRLPSDPIRVDLGELNLAEEQISGIKKIFILACGTAFHAGMVGKYIIEQLAGIPVEVEIASEFRYRNPIINSRHLAIVMSQSGETADTIAALREAKKKGARIIAITNVVGSTVSREADHVLYTWAGPEIAVASTKAYTTQLASIYLIALDLAIKKKRISEENYNQALKALEKIPEHVEAVLQNKTDIQRFANQHFNAEHVFYIGRGLDYVVAMEGSLKLKEISYIHSEAYAAGELKHGAIALIEEGTLVVALTTQEQLLDKMLSNIKEVKSRGAVIMCVAMEGKDEIAKVSDHVIYIPRTLPMLTPILTVVPLQLFAYYVAVEKGCDVDKPRNLAKSVTVE